MVHPLIGYDERTFRLRQMGDGVLGQNSYIIGSDQLRDTVVDLRVNMVRTTCKYDTALVIFF